MLIAKVIGNAVASVKHRSLIGQRLVLVQPLRSLTVHSLIAVDSLGAGVGQLVVITSDGRSARDQVGDQTSPVQWTVMGLVDQESRVLGAMGGSGTNTGKVAS